MNLERLQILFNATDFRVPRITDPIDFRVLRDRPWRASLKKIGVPIV